MDVEPKNMKRDDNLGYVYKVSDFGSKKLVNLKFASVEWFGIQA